MELRLLLLVGSVSAAAVLGDSDLQQPLLSKPSTIPSLGFGTWNLHKPNATETVSAALQAGYRHLDCAATYGNEKEVGKGIADGLNKTGLKRSDVWITSKLWNDQYGNQPVMSYTSMWQLTDVCFAVTSQIWWRRHWIRHSLIWAWTTWTYG